MFLRRSCRFPSTARYHIHSRRAYCAITTTISHQNGFPHNSTPPNYPNSSENSELPPLSIMPMPLLLKSYFITSILASPKIIKFFLPLLNTLANSNSTLLNPDRNPVLHMIVRKFIYDHFIAGENASQVRASVAAMKNLGFSGVILGYAKEVNVTGGEVQRGDGISVSKEVGEKAIREWRDGLMSTLSLLQPGDFLSLKFSGAGPLALHALSNNLPPPPLVQESMHLLLNTALSQKARIWLDAEQQDLQHGIEKWTIDLMRIYNTGPKALLYTTMQAYLKATPANIFHHLQLAQAENWTLGIKLVRGAYIATEKRDLIHDTIQDTHAAYNSIAANLLEKSYPCITTNEKTAYPRAELFLATHNEESIKRAYSIQSSRIHQGKQTIELAFGQLQGMADEISCSLLQLRRNEKLYNSTVSPDIKMALKPKAYKCLVWGSTQECLQFLLRRVKENGDALGRTGFWVRGFRREIWRRVRSGVQGGRRREV
ncbi:f20ddb23-c530-46e9-bfc4-cbc6bd1bc9ae [Sclerotinia trifoliorum]|uniref:Proline dehydrogenase n=1 Tax=Sclerotinia trifoliorum TaxID=28548 RepID=A0A8H2VN96_9HELO|nr:f20ddb23-c530-46e9-bfc4-cbc6bd1bc9ae [Sclerotinia trifoliorum]